MMTRKISRINIFLEYLIDISYISHIYSTSWDVSQIYYLKEYLISWDVSEISYLKRYLGQGLTKEIFYEYSVSTRGMAEKEFNISFYLTSWLGSL